MPAATRPTPAQVTRLWALAHEVPLASAEVYEILKQRYDVDHIRQLTKVQYESFTRDLRDWDASAAEPDIAPIGQYVATVGGCQLMISQLANDGEFFPAWDGEDLYRAGRLLDSFRRYRAKFRRLTPEQIRKIVASWRAYHISVWREAAKRFFTQHSNMDEKYFLGICRRVAKEAEQNGQYAVASM